MRKSLTLISYPNDSIGEARTQQMKRDMASLLFFAFARDVADFHDFRNRGNRGNL